MNLRELELEVKTLRQILESVAEMISDALDVETGEGEFDEE
jgi:hypothetical protein